MTEIWDSESNTSMNTEPKLGAGQWSQHIVMFAIEATLIFAKNNCT